MSQSDLPRESRRDGAKIPLVTRNLRELPPGFSNEQVLHIPVLIRQRSRAPDAGEERRQFLKRLRVDNADVDEPLTAMPKVSARQHDDDIKHPTKSPEEVPSSQEPSQKAQGLRLGCE
ncbi:unnamed protein product [Prorocentrum cordatum]|uniref:Uncharacterized protein n=1 Tax=Prorocentrum cordatum TaxID=2364126 RepID=A0ABN9UHU7_9DINO|nr:unnamed protein product [Polarella glacialis]|mmetsp:Transcript_115625/g.313987  ORF Transcript_115625/g.313987 Transcript_115625/m.313987 type:complete len:118 (-) Transcript_115625:368-721(-)